MNDWKNTCGLEVNLPLSKGSIIDGRTGTWTPIGGTKRSEYTAQEVAVLDQAAAEAHREYLAEQMKLQKMRFQMGLAVQKHKRRWEILRDIVITGLITLIILNLYYLIW